MLQIEIISWFYQNRVILESELVEAQSGVTDTGQRGWWWWMCSSSTELARPPHTWRSWTMGGWPCRWSGRQELGKWWGKPASRWGYWSGSLWCGLAWWGSRCWPWWWRATCRWRWPWWFPRIRGCWSPGLWAPVCKPPVPGTICPRRDTGSELVECRWWRWKCQKLQDSEQKCSLGSCAFSCLKSWK